jgi:nucleoid-associated protein YgaU
VLFDQGKLEKLKLRAFKAAANPDDPPQLSTAPEDTYVVLVNPSSYTLSHLINYSRQRGQGYSASEALYSDSSPVSLNFEFLFDASGVIPPPSEVGDVPLVGAIASALSSSQPYVVMDEIKRFNSLVYNYSGDIHRPRQLQLAWGSLVFNCVLSTLSYRFTLFKQDGTPLRAVASCAFCESVPDAVRVRKDNASSPDLTHIRDIQDGDTLPLLAYQIYGNANLYLEVARANKLIDFRRLRSATRLQFPPVDKAGSS